MKKLIIFCFLIVGTVACFAQGSVRGKIVDRNTNETLPFVNAAVYDKTTDKLLKGAISDEKGLFHITDLPYGSYTLKLTFLDYKELTRDFTVAQDRRHVNYKLLYLAEDTKTLDGITVTAQRQTMKLEVDRK